MDDAHPAPAPAPPLAIRLVVALSLATAVLLVVFPINDYDTFWHLANGRAMVAQGRIIEEEIFSYTAAGTRFENHAWSAQLALYLAYRWGGSAGVVGLKALVVLALLLAGYATARRLGARWTEAALVSLLAVFAGLSRFAARPAIFSLLGIALLGLLLHAYRTGAYRRRALAWIPLIMALWDVLHGALYGVVLLAVFAGSETAKWALRRRLSRWPGARPMPAGRLRALWLALAATLVVMLISPWGLRAYDVLLSFGSSANLMVSMTAEFLPTPLEGHLFFWGFLIVSLAVLAWSWRELDLTEILLLLPFIYIAVRYRRGVCAYALVAWPLVAAHLSRRLQALGGTPWLRRVRPLLLGLPLAALIGLCLLVKLREGRDVDSPWFGYALGLGVNPTYLPPGSARFVKAAGLDGNMFNTDRYGGYLAYHLAPKRKIFHYNHHKIFTELQRFVHDDGYRARWQINYAIVARNDELSMFTREGFVPVYLEPTSAVLVRSAPRNRAIIDRYRVRYFSPLLAEARLRQLAAAPRVYPELVREMSDYLAHREDRAIAGLLGELLVRPGARPSVQRRLQLLGRAERHNPSHPRLLGAAGVLHYQRRDYARAREQLRAALGLAPELTEARLTLAYLDYDQRRFAAAGAGFREVLERHPRHPQAIYGLALVAYRSGDPAGAERHLRRVIALVPSGPWATKARQILARIQAKQL